MNYFSAIRKHIQKEKALLKKALKNTKKARDLAPSAMESGSDVSRSKHEKLAIAIESKIKNIDRYLSLIPTKFHQGKKKKVEMWSLLEIKLGKAKIKLVIVPKGMGGKNIGPVKLVSKDSPLGSTLTGKSIHQEFSFQNQKAKILKPSQGPILSPPAINTLVH